jgi:hypothetical protein
MGGLLGWGRRRRALEIRRYADFAAANSEALQSPETLPEEATPTPVPVPA